jgi:hypothetical protein
MLFKTYRIQRLTKKLQQLQQHRLNHQVPDEVIKKEVAIYFALMQLYKSLSGHKRFPYAMEMSWECLRMAAQLHDAEAMYLLGLHFLNEAKWREQLEKEKLFSSHENQRIMKDYYEKAHAYLAAADKEGHILGKRTHGLCYIFAWGVPQDKDKGFTMVVESIAKENSWQKAPQIFASLGLNKPEFFEAFVKHQGKQH